MKFLSGRAVLTAALFFSACDIDGPFNSIPCKYNFKALDDTLKLYGVQTFSARPEGFSAKSYYPTESLDCGTWNIAVGMGGNGKLVFDERFAAMLAGKVFYESLTDSISILSLSLNRVYNRDSMDGNYGDVSVSYYFVRGMDTAGSSRLNPTNSATPVETISESEVETRDGRSVEKYRSAGLTVRGIPHRPYAIARDYWLRHKACKEIKIYVRQTGSRFCVAVTYQFFFDSTIQPAP